MMAGHRPFSELRDKMPVDRRTQNDAKTQQILAEMLLSEARKAQDVTQVELAEKLGIKQPTLSHMESQDDMQVSTLRRIIEALGGSMEIIAHLPQGDVKLRQFQ